MLISSLLLEEQTSKLAVCHSLPVIKFIASCTEEHTLGIINRNSVSESHTGPKLSELDNLITPYLHVGFFALYIYRVKYFIILEKLCG